MLHKSSDSRCLIAFLLVRYDTAYCGPASSVPYDLRQYHLPYQILFSMLSFNDWLHTPETPMYLRSRLMHLSCKQTRLSCSRHSCIPNARHIQMVCRSTLPSHTICGGQWGMAAKPCTTSQSQSLRHSCQHPLRQTQPQHATTQPHMRSSKRAMDLNQMLGPLRISLKKMSGKHQVIQTVSRGAVLPLTAAGEASMQRLLRAVLASGRWSYARRSWWTGRASISLLMASAYMQKVTCDNVSPSLWVELLNLLSLRGWQTERLRAQVGSQTQTLWTYTLSVT